MLGLARIPPLSLPVRVPLSQRYNAEVESLLLMQFNPVMVATVITPYYVWYSTIHPQTFFPAATIALGVTFSL